MMISLRLFSILLLSLSFAAAQETLQLTLPEAERLAIQNNPQFAGAKLRAAAAYEVPKEIAANYQPSLTGSFTGVGADSGSRIAAGGLNNPIVYSRLGSGLGITQMITDFGRTSNLAASATLRAQAQDQATETTRSQILLATDRAYFELLKRRSVLRVAQQTVESRQLIADQVTALAEAQLKSQLDVSFAKVNLADAKLLFSSALNGVQSAEADLAAAMGLPNQKAFGLAEEPMPEPLPDQIEPLLRDALQKRPELANLRLEQGAAERFVKAEKALILPSIGLIATAGFVPAGPQTVPGQFGAAGVNVTIPVFNGGLFKARRNEAEFRARAAAESVADLTNRVLRDVRVAYLNASTAFDRVGLTEQLLQQAQLALDLAQSRYDLGLGTIVELSQSQLNLTSAQIASASAKYDYQSQRSLLSYQVGDLR